MDITQLTDRQKAILNVALQVALDCGPQDREPIDGKDVTDEEYSQLLRATATRVTLAEDGWQTSRPIRTAPLPASATRPARRSGGFHAVGNV